MNSGINCGARRGNLSNQSAKGGQCGGETLQDIRQQQFYIQKLKEQRLKVKAMKEQYDRKEEEVNELKHEVKGLQSKANSLSAVRLHYQTTLTETEKLALQNKATGSQVAELKETLGSLKHQHYKNQVFSLRKEASSAAAALQYCNIRKERLMKTLANITKERDDLKDSHDTELQIYKLKWGKLCSDLNQLQTEQSKVKETNLNLGKQIANQAQQLEKLLSEKKAIKARADKFTEEAAKGKLQLLALKGKSEVQIRKLNDQISDVDITQNKLAGQIDKKKSVVHDLKKRDKENEARLGLLGNDLAKLEGRAGVCEAELLKSQALVVELQATTGEQQAQIKSLKAELGKLAREEEQVNRKRVQQTKCRGSTDMMLNQLIKQKNEEAVKLEQLMDSFRKK